jgi:hypothetical protein
MSPAARRDSAYGTPAEDTRSLHYGLIRSINFNVNDISRSARIKMSHAMPFAEVVILNLRGVSIFQGLSTKS